MRFAPTMKEVAEAATRLPSPYSVQANGPVTRYRVAHMGEFRTASLYDPQMRTDCYVNTLDFEIDTLKDHNGATWKRWVYNGPVQV
jgi:hypothetical protein